MPNDTVLDSELYFEEALDNIANKNYDAAINYLTLAIDNDNTNLDYILTLADVFWRMGYKDEYLQCCANVTDILNTIDSSQPRHWAIFAEFIGQYFENEGKYKKAIHCYKQAISTYLTLDNDNLLILEKLRNNILHCQLKIAENEPNLKVRLALLNDFNKAHFYLFTKTEFPSDYLLYIGAKFHFNYAKTTQGLSHEEAIITENYECAIATYTQVLELFSEANIGQLMIQFEYCECLSMYSDYLFQRAPDKRVQEILLILIKLASELNETFVELRSSDNNYFLNRNNYHNLLENAPDIISNHRSNAHLKMAYLYWSENRWGNANYYMGCAKKFATNEQQIDLIEKESKTLTSQYNNHCLKAPQLLFKSNNAAINSDESVVEFNFSCY